MLVSRVLFNSWQDKKYWLEAISDDAKEMQQTSSETTSGQGAIVRNNFLLKILGCETDEDDTLTFSQ